VKVSESHSESGNARGAASNFYITKNTSFADAFNAAYMLAQKIPSVYSWDEDFDKIEGIVRLEPEAE